MHIIINSRVDNNVNKYKLRKCDRCTKRLSKYLTPFYRKTKKIIFYKKILITLYK